MSNSTGKTRLYVLEMIAKQMSRNTTGIDNYIRSLCRFLGLSRSDSEKIVRHVMTLHQRGVLLPTLMDELKLARQDREVSAVDSVESVFSRMSPLDGLFFVLALVLIVGVTYGVWRKLSDSRSNPLNSNPSSAVDTKPFMLVLVINASQEILIETIRTRGVSALGRDQLYKATQSLWFGRGDDIKFTEINGWFDDSREVSELSEYDVHLVCIEQSVDDSGLCPRVNPMDRLDAFRRVEDSHGKIKVSKRLPSEAYGTTGVYSK